MIKYILLFYIFLIAFAFFNVSETNAKPKDLNGITDVQEKLRVLQELLDEGFITFAEYEKKKQDLTSKLQQTRPKYDSTIDNIQTDIVDNKKAIFNEKHNFNAANAFIKYYEPEFLTFKELESLYYNPSPEGYLKEKLHKFFRDPIISNEAYYHGNKPHRPIDPLIGPCIRVASWNIEKSMNVKDAVKVFKSEYELLDRIDPQKLNRSLKIETVIEQRNKFLKADIIVLQEMEIGMKRSGYLNAAKEIAHTLGMNYTYAPQYLEVDPVQLGLEKIYFEEGKLDEEATNYFLENKDLYKGVFGSAVLSRYPIKNVVLFPLEYQGYDWYSGEKPNTTFLEKTRRFGSKVAFKNELTREMKVGGRHFFRVDLEVPDIPEKTLTIINIHLEIKCLPAAREKQITEILSYIKEIKNPVVVLGDFNSAPADLSPTSATRMASRSLKNRSNWLSAATTLTGAGLFINSARNVTNAVKNLQNPLARDIPFIAPNKVKGLFDAIENFRFDDGGAFDFRGDSKRSVNGKDGKLANSNQRDLKAFKTTFRVKRVIAKIIGTFRLDWVFVKSFLKDPLNQEGPYRLAPHFGETLSELNNSLFVKISDHDPNVVDLPIFEPTQYFSELYK